MGEYPSAEHALAALQEQIDSEGIHLTRNAGRSMNPRETLTDEALLLKLRGTEHDFVERKPKSQKGEWLQVAVAFANSAPIGWPAVLFVGVDDDGTPQQGPEKLEDLSKSVAAVIEQSYPPIYFDIRPLRIGDRACLAVVIPGSENRPHFAGRAYTRVGPSVRDASEQQFAELIASRNSKARAILEWKGREISIENFRSSSDQKPMAYPQPVTAVVIADCNAHFVTFGLVVNGLVRPYSEPLSRIVLSFDHKQQRLLLFVYRDR